MKIDLIIKVSEACGWGCTFCSSTSIQAQEAPNLELESIRKFLVRFPETNTIIVNGGDPLVMRPQYYWDILSMLDELKMPQTTLSFTTNLWPFFKKPELWQDIFRHPQVGVATSFQYGNARLKPDRTPYTESEFWAVSDLFLERVGYRPGFIAVITPENESTVLQTVRLAKEMGVVCKVNYAMASGPVKMFKGIRMGNAESTYLLADIYREYLGIHAAGLTAWEHNTQQLVKRLQGEPTTCPQAKDCDSHIRTLQPGNKYYSCGAFGDDDLYPINFEQELAGDFVRPLQVAELHSLKQACFECPMFAICNGCKKTVHDLKRLNLVESHCFKMKQLAPAIIEANGLTGHLIPTAYVNES